MIDWTVVAAFISPLVAAIGLTGAWFAWLDRKRKAFLQNAINQAVMALELRLSTVERAIADTTAHLSRQDDALSQAMQAIARIEGRLMGQSQSTENKAP